MTLEEKIKNGMLGAVLALSGAVISCNPQKPLHVPAGEEILVRQGKAIGNDRVEKCYRGPADISCYEPCTMLARLNISPQQYQQTITMPTVTINSKKMQVSYKTELQVEPTSCSIEVLLRDYQGNHWLEALQGRMGPSIEKIIQEYEATGQTMEPSAYLAAHLPDEWVGPFTYSGIKVTKETVEIKRPVPKGCAARAYRKTHFLECLFK